MSELNNVVDKTTAEGTKVKNSSRRDALNKLGKYSAGGAALAFYSSRTNAQPNCSSTGIMNSTGNNNNANGCN